MYLPHGCCKAPNSEGFGCQRDIGHPGQHQSQFSHASWGDAPDEVIAMMRPEEVTVTMRVPMSERTYRKLKAAASLRGVGQGQLAAQIVEERLGDYMNFNGIDEVGTWRDFMLRDDDGNQSSGESV